MKVRFPVGGEMSELGREMMVEPMRTVRGESGDTFIRPSAHWADRAVPVLFACGCLLWAGRLWQDTDAMSAARVAESVAGLWLMFGFLLIALALACARIAWSFVGVTKISVSSDELIVRHCLAGETISTSAPIRLSKIRDVRIDERETSFKGNLWRRWALIVQLDDGSERRVANFRNTFDANEFLQRCVR